MDSEGRDGREGERADILAFSDAVGDENPPL